MSFTIYADDGIECAFHYVYVETLWRIMNMLMIKSMLIYSFPIEKFASQNIKLKTKLSCNRYSIPHTNAEINLFHLIYVFSNYYIIHLHRLHLHAASSYIHPIIFN